MAFSVDTDKDFKSVFKKYTEKFDIPYTIENQDTVMELDWNCLREVFRAIGKDGFKVELGSSTNGFFCNVSVLCPDSENDILVTSEHHSLTAAVNDALYRFITEYHE